jgi:hypothetical protein
MSQQPRSEPREPKLKSVTPSVVAQMLYSSLVYGMASGLTCRAWNEDGRLHISVEGMMVEEEDGKLRFVPVLSTVTPKVTPKPERVTPNKSVLAEA